MADGIIPRIFNGVKVGLASIRGTPEMEEFKQEVPNYEENLNALIKSGELNDVIFQNEAVQKEIIKTKNKLQIFTTSSDLYAWHNNIIRRSITSLDMKNKMYPHGDPQRDFILAEFWKEEPILAGAVYSMAAKMSSLSWTIIGKKRLATYFAQICNGALSMNGVGWGDFIASTAQDFYTADRGSFWVTPRDGSHLSGRLAEIAVMDALACAMTGNMRQPVLYSSAITGQDLWLRPGEYSHFASMPSPREEFFGIGYCATSRAYRSARILIGLSEYDWEKLNNLPPEGVAAISGLTLDEFQDSLTLWKASRERRESLTYPQVLWLLGSQPNTTVSVDFVGFSQIPESFVRRDVVEQYVNVLALDFGVDSREFWPISTSSLGTAAESEIQHMKAKGKGPGEFISIIERYLNGEMPEGVEFEFDTQDIAEDLAAAQQAKAWIEAYMMLYTGSAKGGGSSSPTNPTPKLTEEGAPKPTSSSSMPAAPSGAEGVISKDELLRLLADRGAIPNWLVKDKRVMLSDTGIMEKEGDGDTPVMITWKEGVLTTRRIPAYEIQSAPTQDVPRATLLPFDIENSVQRHPASLEDQSAPDSILEFLKQLEDEILEQSLERGIRGKPLPATESLRGPRVSKNAITAELERWRNHPILSQYVPTIEERLQTQKILATAK